MSESDIESPQHLPIGCKDDPLEKQPMMGQKERTPRRTVDDQLNFDPILMNKRLNDSNIALDNFDISLVESQEYMQKGPTWVVVATKFFTLSLLMYSFICSLELMSTSFRLAGGKTANRVISQSELLQNPIVGLMIGVLVTVLVQSSSTSTSIVVTMVSSGLISVRSAIPIVMGANIGTSVTNTIVSLMQASDRKEFGLAFAAATVHDMFNWLTVIILLPLEIIFGYLEHTTSYLVNLKVWDSSSNSSIDQSEPPPLIKRITKPFVSLVVKINTRILEQVNMDSNQTADTSIMLPCCDSLNSSQHKEQVACLSPCTSLFNLIGLSDGITGLFLLGISLVMLCTCLILVVKLLHSMLKGRIAMIIKTYINADYKFPLSILIGYVAILIGCGMTIMVQSSSIFTSALTPLAGMGVISLERVYPLTLGSNIGTTTTGLLAAMAADEKTLKNSMQLALCHLLFNVTGILIFYPLPWARLPVVLAKMLGRTTARYRWFSIFYLLFMFFLLPMFVFFISLLGQTLFAFFAALTLITILIIVAINMLQRKRPSILPIGLRNWEFLSPWLRSLDPYDGLILKFTERCFLINCCVQPDSAHDLPMLDAAAAHLRNQSHLHILDAAQTESSSDVHLMAAYDNVMFVNWGSSLNNVYQSNSGKKNQLVPEDAIRPAQADKDHKDVATMATDLASNPVATKPKQSSKALSIPAPSDTASPALVQFYVHSNANSPK